MDSNRVYVNVQTQTQTQRTKLIIKAPQKATQEEMDKKKEMLVKHLPENWRVEIIEISEDEDDTVISTPKPTESNHEKEDSDEDYDPKSGTDSVTDTEKEPPKHKKANLSEISERIDKFGYPEKINKNWYVNWKSVAQWIKKQLRIRTLCSFPVMLPEKEVTNSAKCLNAVVYQLNNVRNRKMWKIKHFATNFTTHGNACREINSESNSGLSAGKLKWVVGKKWVVWSYDCQCVGRSVVVIMSANGGSVRRGCWAGGIWWLAFQPNRLLISEKPKINWKLTQTKRNKAHRCVPCLGHHSAAAPVQDHLWTCQICSAL